MAQDGGYIMDAGALILDDARIDCTLEHGLYSQNAAVLPEIEAVKRFRRPRPGHQLQVKGRKPGVCVPWEVKRRHLPIITGDESRVKSTWEMIDSMGYFFLWVNLTW
jgi:hypothetical protein